MFTDFTTSPAVFPKFFRVKYSALVDATPTAHPPDRSGRRGLDVPGYAT
jgi:hypothetical protein